MVKYDMIAGFAVIYCLIFVFSSNVQNSSKSLLQASYLLFPIFKGIAVFNLSHQENFVRIQSSLNLEIE